MIRATAKWLSALMASFMLSGCVGQVWTGVTMVYERHHIYRRFNDFQLSADVNRVLFEDRYFKNPHNVIDVTVFRGEVLLSGHLYNKQQLRKAVRRVKKVDDYRRLYNQLTVQDKPSSSFIDGWITTKIRTKIIMDSTIDPNRFKVVTSDKTVYLLGTVRPKQGEKVLAIARNTSHVKKVVMLWRYAVPVSRSAYKNRSEKG